MSGLFDSPGNIYGNEYWGYKAISVEDVREYLEREAACATEFDYAEFEKWQGSYHPVLLKDILSNNGFEIDYEEDLQVTVTTLYKIKNPETEFQEKFRLRVVCTYGAYPEKYTFEYLYGNQVLPIAKPEFLHSLQSLFRLADGSDIYFLEDLNKDVKSSPEIETDEEGYDVLPF